MKLRLKEQLAKETEQSRNKGVEGSGGVPGLSITARASSNTREVYERSETLLGLIESHLHSRNLMMIIVNADDLNPSDFRSTIYDIFTASVNFDHKAALMLMYTLPFNSNGIWQDDNWFTFIPEELVKDEELVEFVWSRLKSEQRDIFGNSSILKEYLSDSKGSRGILRENWNKKWEE